MWWIWAIIKKLKKYLVKIFVNKNSHWEIILFVSNLEQVALKIYIHRIIRRVSLGISWINQSQSDYFVPQCQYQIDLSKHMGLLPDILLKGQIISKRFLVSSISSKKRTNEFVFTPMILVFVRFLEEIEDIKKPFWNYLTFSHHNYPM